MKTAVAVSGGVDSLTALALLERSGQDVFAVHGRFIDTPGEPAVLSNLADNCARLGVDLLIPDLRREFEELVIKPFIASYKAGNTPNPCVRCNREVKFGILFEYARACGAQKLATGHYAAILNHPLYGATIGQGADSSKDQSYFLAGLPASLMDRIEFPLSGIHKKDIPQLFAEFGLNPPKIAESQDVCFIPSEGYRDFLLRHGGGLSGEGDIVNREGRVLGRHRGLWAYTCGQRRGLGIPAAEPLYVLEKKVEDNVLVVGFKSETYTETCFVGEANLLVPRHLWPETPLIRTLYRRKPAECRAEFQGNGIFVRFARPELTPTPGQTAAFYSPDGCLLGGGIFTPCCRMVHANRCIDGNESGTQPWRKVK